MIFLLIFLAIALVLAAALIARVRTAIGMRSGDQATIKRKRYANKRWNNRLTTSIGRAGQPHSIFAMVRHVGRRSGKAYATPVRALPVEGGFIIPLTYGQTADWYRNIEAAGGDQLDWHGKTYNVGRPQIANAAEVLPAYPLPSRFLFWLDGVPQFVRVPTNP